MRFAQAAGALALTVAALAPAAAGAADYRSSTSERRVYAHPESGLPACGDPAVASYIAGRFTAREREYWGSSLELAVFTRPRQLGYRSWGPEFIPRRFCTAGTVTTDGRRREVHYVIGQGLGMFGVSYGVEWCVTGLDRNYAYAPHCKMAQP